MRGQPQPVALSEGLWSVPVQSEEDGRELDRVIEGLNPSAGPVSAPLSKKEQEEPCQSYKLDLFSVLL